MRKIRLPVVYMWKICAMPVDINAFQTLDFLFCNTIMDRHFLGTSALRLNCITKLYVRSAFGQCTHQLLVTSEGCSVSPENVVSSPSEQSLGLVRYVGRPHSADLQFLLDFLHQICQSPVGFDQIIVGVLHALGDRLGIGEVGENDYRHVSAPFIAVSADAPQDGQAVHLRHENVQDNQVRTLEEGHFKTSAAGCGGQDLKIFSLESIPQQRNQRRLILNDQNAFAVFGAGGEVLFWRVSLGHTI